MRGDAMFALTCFFLLCAAALALPAIASSQPTLLSPGWYRNNGRRHTSEIYIKNTAALLNRFSRCRISCAMFTIFLVSTLAALPRQALPHTNPPVEYDLQASQIMLKRITHPIPLSQSDQEAIYRLRDIPPDDITTGELYKSHKGFIIEHVEPGTERGSMRVEISSQDYMKARHAAVKWLQTMGLSKDGICNYPFQFYLSSEAAESLRGKGVVFSNLADECIKR